MSGISTGRTSSRCRGTGRRCQLGPGAGALEQPRRQPRLELADLAAHGGLRGAQLARRAGEVAVPRDALEGDQRVRGKDAVRVAPIHDSKPLCHATLVRIGCG